MQKKIAIAVDGSVHCGCAVRYAANMAKVLPELYFELVHVHPSLSQYLIEEAERKAKANRALQAVIKANREASLDMLEKVRRQMVQLGVDAQRIELCSRIRTTGLAEDLLDECRSKAYDAIVLGRRGVTYLQELVTGSVTANLLEHSQVTPVWMVDGEVPDNRIVLAVDGSQNALRALDHYAFMLGGQKDAKIHIIHVKPRLRDICTIDFDSQTLAAAEEVVLDSDRHCIDQFYSQALGVFKKNGLETDQLDIETIESRISVAGAILDAARKGGFGTIVVGRRGFKNSKFSGSVSRSIIQKATRMAVWLVP